MSFQSVVPFFTVEIATSESEKILLKILCKILLPPNATSLTGLEVFYDCSGGNSRPSRLSDVGGGNFLRMQSVFFSFSCSCSCSCSITTFAGKTPNAQRPTSNVEISRLASRRMANRVHCFGTDHCNNDSRHLLAFGELADAHSAAKHC
jgi:hypothetical protein